MKTTFIYELIDPRTNDPYYIGKSNNPKVRLNTHIKRAQNNLSYVYKENWIRSLLKEGLKPIMNIIDEVSFEEWEFWEKYYISLYKSFGFNLTNTTEGGEGGNSKNQSKDTIKKRIETRKNNNKPWISEEQKEKIRVKMMGNKNMLGKYHSLESKIKMSIKHKENITSEFKEKMRIINLGNKNRKGKKCSEETKNKLRKKILQLTLNGEIISEFESYTEAMNTTKISGINNCLRNKAKTAGGYIWKYKSTV